MKIKYAVVLYIDLTTYNIMMVSTINNSRKIKSILVLKEAMLSSLYATKRLTSKHTGKDFEKWVNKISNLIDKAYSKYQKSKRDGSADFTIIVDIEKNIRKWHFQIVRIWLKSWGINVKKRIRNSQANQDYFNQLLDIAGAIQRDFACRYYWFPSVIEYNYFDDVDEIINIMHEDLPSLDFIEITRPFIQEMTMWFTLFHIPVYKCKQYFWYFLIECRPYLDWIYNGGSRGVNSKGDSISRKWDTVDCKFTFDRKSSNIDVALGGPPGRLKIDLLLSNFIRKLLMKLKDKL
ncbi:MAG: hypothetical protein HeimC2_21260 [Candidatus Heimdallarchaeota archaeon LC_2]|nr:MAG: hypothetical protein HeimC2_21260 [Candidatus Heimdallarchaeota archaeon LC_2]